MFNGECSMLNEHRRPFNIQHSQLKIQHFDSSQPVTSNPIDRAVPSTVFTAASSDAAFRSGILVLAISSTCFFVTLPTLVLFGTPEPFGIPAALSSRMAAGGVFVMKVNVRSEK